jgi:predicted pyridoxine 5'-phosphate oxidase superfamily flavin-nucleotide-binding protein
MGKLHNSISAELREWIAAQPVFFVATAPSSSSGHVNCSPKGGDTLRVLGPAEIAYLDWVGSGAETVAHLRENGRIVIMFCAFQGTPRIVRLHGRGEVFTPGDARFAELAAQFPPHPGSRAIIVVQLSRVSQSCGTGVPLMAFERHRDEIADWALKKGADGLKTYMAQKNQRSIDGVPAFTPAPEQK